MADEQPPPPTLPPYEPFPGSRTPGWNDPPALQYNPLAAGSSSGRTRLNLNKRVAFPLQGSPSSDVATAKPTAIVSPNVAGTTHPIAVVHPMPNMNAPPSIPRVPILPTTIKAATHVPIRTFPSSVLPADARETSLRTLREQVVLVQESPNVRHEEIQRRLGLIEQAWESGNLNKAVQEKIYRLAKSISDKNFYKAMEIYTNVAVCHSDECAIWVVALRHIVLTLEAHKTDSSTVAATATTAAIPEVTGEFSNVANIPSVFVQAMPRQIPTDDTSSTLSTTETATVANTSTIPNYSAVQHI